MTTPRPRSRPLRAPCLVAAALLALSAPPVAADLDVAFVLDTTGSMSGELAEAQERLQQLALALATARAGERVRFGVVAFRDRGDDYVTRRSPLSADLADTTSFLSLLSADGGGDGPESVLAALATALRDLDWDRRGATERRVVLVGDAPAHLDYPDEPTVDELVAEARAAQIVVDAIGCRSLPPEGVTLFRTLAYSTEGSYQHIGRVETPRGALMEALGRVATASRDELADPGQEVRLEPLGAEPATARGLLVHRLAPAEGAGAGSACLLAVELPRGVGLGAPPGVWLAGGALRVQLVLAEGDGGRERYAMDPCPPLVAPVHVRLEGR
jgi:hypothetical protein